MIRNMLVALAIAFAPLYARAEISGNLVEKAGEYLNDIKGLEGDFIQTSPGGKLEKGRFYMLRPGKLRLDYAKMPVQLISDGSNMFFYDKSLDQITTIPTSSTPASILARKKIDLKNADIKVIETNQNSRGFDLKLILKDNPGLGEMRVVFAGDPVRLAGWELIDATGGATIVELSGLSVRTDFPKGFWNVQRHKTSGIGTGDSYYE